MNRRISTMILALLLLACGAVSVAAQTAVSDTLTVYFRLASTYLDLNFRDNRRNIADYARRIEAARRESDHPLVVVVHSGASPEGSSALNYQLSLGRAHAIHDQLRAQLGDRLPDVQFTYEGARWDEFEAQVASLDTPWRQQVLDVLRDTTLFRPRNTRVRDEREVRIRAIGGDAWQYLLDNLMPDLRSSTVYMYRLTFPVAAVEELRAVAAAAAVPPPPAPVALDLTVPPRPAAPDTLPDAFCWALKTNLLMWAVVAPNVQVEFPLGRSNRWSIEAEYVHPWWIWSHNAHAEEVFDLGVEARLWLGNRHRRRYLDGHHLGLAVHTGYFDMEWKRSEGYQGEQWLSYLNYGYQHRFRGNRWAMDFGAGVGLLSTPYRHYYGDTGDRHLIWHDTGHYRWFGPVHANWSIVYTFPLRDRRRGDATQTATANTVR